METLESDDIINKMNLMNSYRSFYPNNKEDTFFSSANRTFSKFSNTILYPVSKAWVKASY